jgi:hypothetical protein
MRCALAALARGDYEDPDRTAWTPDDAEEEQCDRATRGVTEEAFPGEE